MVGGDIRNGIYRSNESTSEKAQFFRDNECEYRVVRSVIHTLYYKTILCGLD
jgi:hypothetical protein